MLIFKGGIIMQLTKEDLKIAREYILNLNYDTNNRVILPGNNAILLKGTKFSVSDTKKEEIETLLKTTDSDSLKGKISTLSDEYLAAILYLLNKELGCHVILEDYQVPDGASRYANFDLVRRIYSDLELVKYIKNNEIKALSVLSFRNNSQTRSNESLDVCENNSSYNFAGISLFSSTLANIAYEKGLFTTRGFSATPSVNEMCSAHSFFDDELILNARKVGYDIGKEVDRELDAGEIWPYTLEAIFKVQLHPSFEELNSIYEILYEHSRYVEERIQEKGLKKAFARK